MKTRFRIILPALAILACASIAGVYAAAQKNNTGAGAKPADAGKKLPFERVVKSEAEWKKILTPLQFEVTRKAGTEPAFRNEYWNNHQNGIYRCVDCGLELFTSKTKFESGTGWPSFWQPIEEIRIAKHSDFDLGVERTEVRCARCDAHLGHVFDDGQFPNGKRTPTGLRFCMNSAALKFVPDAKGGTKPKSAPQKP